MFQTLLGSAYAVLWPFILHCRVCARVDCQQTHVSGHSVRPGLLWPADTSRPLLHQSCQVMFGLPTRAVPSSTNHARSCLTCQHEPSPPPPIMPGLVWPANTSRPLHHQSCQVLFDLPTRAVPSTTNHARSCLACQHEPSPPPPIMPGLVWPADKSRPLHLQSCQVMFGLPTGAVPSNTNHARSCLACRQQPSPPPPIMPGLVWPDNRSRPLHHQSCQVLFGLPTGAVPSTTNHARSCLACRQEPSPPPPIMPGHVWPADRSRPLHHQSCQVLFGLPTAAVSSTTNHARSCLA